MTTECLRNSRRYKVPAALCVDCTLVVVVADVLLVALEPVVVVVGCADRTFVRVLFYACVLYNKDKNEQLRE